MPATKRSQRRDGALSSDRIVGAAVEILDRDGEHGLTFRTLTSRLATGAGAVYHHVSDKDELLAAATDRVVGELLGRIEPGRDPARALRSISLGIFDAIDAHPWVGAQLARHPLPAVLRIWKAVGGQLHALGLAGSAQSDAGSALVSYVLGAAAQHAAGARTAPHGTGRQAYLDRLAEQLTTYDADPVVGELAAHLRDHDDREQFLAGVDIFLAGVAARS